MKNNQIYSLNDGLDSFEVMVLKAEKPLRTILFATGAGGNPARHLSLLQFLAKQNCMVIAPHFERLTSIFPDIEALHSRARRLELAIKTFAPSDLRISGIGHSTGATMLLALAGGQARTVRNEQLSVQHKINFDRLVLFAPATDFFRMPGALDSIYTPILIFTGTSDVITPPAQSEFLKSALEPRIKVKVRTVEGAGHFTFMNELPPHIHDSYPDREELLLNLADEIHRFAAS